jgi:hypothetical protein
MPSPSCVLDDIIALYTTKEPAGLAANSLSLHLLYQDHAADRPGRPTCSNVVTGSEEYVDMARRAEIT